MIRWSATVVLPTRSMTTTSSALSSSSDVSTRPAKHAPEGDHAFSSWLLLSKLLSNTKPKTPESGFATFAAGAISVDEATCGLIQKGPGRRFARRESPNFPFGHSKFREIAAPPATTSTLSYNTMVERKPQWERFQRWSSSPSTWKSE